MKKVPKNVARKEILINENVELLTHKPYSEDKEFHLGERRFYISSKTMRVFNISSGQDLMGRKVSGLGDETRLSIAQVV